MSQTIKTYTDLCDERERIKSLLEVQRQKVKVDWQDLKDEFLPVRNAFGVVGKFARPDRSNPIINAGLKVAGDLFLKHFILAKAGWATKLAVPFVVKNYTSHLLVDKGASFMSKLANIFAGRRKRRTRTSMVPDMAPASTLTPVTTVQETTTVIVPNPNRPDIPGNKLNS